LVREEHKEDDDAVDEKHICPKVDVHIARIVQLIDQDNFENEDRNHYVKLHRVFKNSVL